MPGPDMLSVWSSENVDSTVPRSQVSGYGMSADAEQYGKWLCLRCDGSLNNYTPDTGTLRWILSDEIFPHLLQIYYKK